MRISEIAEKHGWNAMDFETFILHKTDIKAAGMLATSIPDKDVSKAVELYSELLNQKQQEIERAKEAAERAEQEAKEAEQRKIEAVQKEAEKQKAISKMLISSGFSFEGYRIVKYSGYISGDDAIQIDRDELFAGQGQKLTDALVQIRIQALKELKEAAYDLGCNAVIGVDFDYMTFEPETISSGGGTHYYEPYVVCVTANGNAVVIEKE